MLSLVCSPRPKIVHIDFNGPPNYQSPYMEQRQAQTDLASTQIPNHACNDFSIIYILMSS